MSIQSPKRVGAYTKSGSVASTPKAKPQATKLGPKAADATPKAKTGGF
jgi:hypothetical protein